MTFQPGTASEVSGNLVQISISGRNLLDMDVFSKSDPMCLVFGRSIETNSWKKIAQTETIDNNLNPDFVKKVELPYFFERKQDLSFRMYDVDSSSSDPNDHDFIGEVQCTLAAIVSASGLFTAPLRTESGQEGGILILRAEEVESSKDEVHMQFLGKKLDRKDFFGSSDPFLEFSRLGEDGSFIVTHRTEFIKRNRNPVWKPIVIPLSILCNSSLDVNLRVRCFDYNNNGNHSFIGEFNTTLRNLRNFGPSEATILPLINSKKQAKKSRYKNSGLIHLMSCKIVKVYSFLDYIRGGTELSCSFSIDFTASNGDPNTVNSHHHIGRSNRLNAYEMALSSIGQIIEEYDSDRLFPVLGFGARLPPDGRVSHLFFVNGDSHNPYCQGMNGVLDAYRSCIRRIQLFGPTNFAPTISHVADYAKKFVDGSQYFILLIVTDGVITDMPQTKTAIVDASCLPLSIIIVGVGDADFESMEELDGDEARLHDGSRYAERDIVQFVPLNKFIHCSRSHVESRQILAKEVLYEIPEQFLSFMKRNKIVPKPPQGQIRIPSDPEMLKRMFV